MAKKEFTYKGKNADELKAMDLEEYMQIVPARLRRSLKRGFTDEQKIFLEKLKKKKVVKTHCRDMPIVPVMIGKTILVYRGNKFDSVIITAEMVGHFLGEFVQTRGGVKHSSPGVGATRSSSAVSVR